MLTARVNLFEELIKNIEDNEIVILTKNRVEFLQLQTLLEKYHFKYAIPSANLHKVMSRLAMENDYKGGWRISRKRGIIYNKSSEYWHNHYCDIFEINSKGDLDIACV